MLTFHDMFCGAGGSSLGAYMAGATPIVGMNHWPVACESYEANHAHTGARAACVDVVTQDPRRYPTADLLLASPECTHHSYARGKPKDDPSLFDPLGDQGAERSRATMWDVVRFAEVHEYRAIIVENVEAAVKWGLPRGRKLKHGHYGPLFVAWLQSLEALDYRWQLVHLNSMVCGVPQSRDRLYVVFWKKGQRAPDLDIRALGWCPRCDKLVDGIQTMKRPGATTGAYSSSYVYRCPGCTTEIALAIRPAAAAVDWSIEAVRIGDRKVPLKPATMQRIYRGLPRLKERPQMAMVVPAGSNPGRERLTASEAFPSLTRSDRLGLVVQVGGNLAEREGQTRAKSTDEPTVAITPTSDRALVIPTTHDDASDRARKATTDILPSQTTRQEQALVVSNMAGNVPRVAVDEAMGTITTGNKLALVVEARGNPSRPGGGNTARRVDEEAIGTVSAQGNHHALVIANYGKATGGDAKQGWARHADDETLGTVTATDSHALFTYRQNQDVGRLEDPLPTVATVEQHALLGEVTQEEVEACTFRMLQPHELKVASGFTDDYTLHGTKRDQVALVGNAVTAPAEAELVRRVLASLDEATA